MIIEDINLRRFFTKIRQDIVPLLDADDITENKQATMGLTALFLVAEAGMPPDQASVYVVDGTEDLGIDGLYFNSAIQTLYIVQSKFRINQTKTISQGDALKFKMGIEKVLQGKINEASSKFISAYEKIEHALSDINTRIKICISCTTKNDLEPNVEKIFKDFCENQNDIDTIFSFQYFKFDQLFQMAKFFSLSPDTTIDLDIFSYGSVLNPYKAFFGFVKGEAVASWVKKHGNSLFEQNVRFTLHNTDVNESIFETIKNDPDKFWYYNNGITAIASEARPSPSEGDPKHVNARSMSIVNGAQTAGMLARAAEENLDLSEINVQFRVISLAGAAPGLDEDVTRANNTQNELNPLDFVSLDPHQDLLRTELSALGYDYIIKRGSDTSSTSPKIEVKDAAVALACAADDIGISVQSKRYVSGLWNNIKAPPYTTIFHAGLRGTELLNIWKAYKQCENAIKEAKQGMDRQEALILTHGDKFIAHCTFRRFSDLGDDLTNEEKVARVSKNMAKILPGIYAEKITTTYPATAFKNQRTQEELRQSLMKIFEDTES